MAGIATRYVTENELNTEMSIEELRYGFSKEQTCALVPLQPAGRKKGGTIPDTPDASDITQEAEPEAVNTCQISPKEIIRDLAKPKALSGTASNASAGLSRLTRLRRELKALRASKKIISSTFIPDTTRSANKIQKENRLLRENEGIYYPDHFSLESVKERLDMYDVSVQAPDLQALADVMIMLCIRPSEIKDLRISNGSITGYSKNRDQQDIPQVFRSLEKNEKRARQLLTWIQDAIFSGQLRDPGKPGVLWFNTLLKKDEFLPEIGKPLLSSSLHKIGAVFAVISHGAKNLSEAMTIASEALRHSPDNHVSPAKNYTIAYINITKIVTDQPKALRVKHPSDSTSNEREVIRYTKKLAQIFGLDEQNAEVYTALSSENRALVKRLDDYYFQHKKLKKKVKRLEERVKWLDDNVDVLLAMGHCNCSKESINTSSESSSSE
ncbi:hypothetical protein RhiirC2_794591 [Rhizophagus irregularis]|uniref:Uncharacterized protein n=1 Tax=Rhizophagus irregularis TaxID=588596 RepID=A0A2N1MD94_9GLOM|nr:hypothetical protein RhiirC2_794591 [Rhizophagus irregularis]